MGVGKLKVGVNLLTATIFAVPVLGLLIPGTAENGFLDPEAKFFGELIF